MIIKDLTVFKEMDISEMSAVHGGEHIELVVGDPCVNVGATLENGAKSGGGGGLILAAVAVLGTGMKPC